jgi:hypothetical protein
VCWAEYSETGCSCVQSQSRAAAKRAAAIPPDRKQSGSVSALGHFAHGLLGFKGDEVFTQNHCSIVKIGQAGHLARAVRSHAAETLVDRASQVSRAQGYKVLFICSLLSRPARCPSPQSHHNARRNFPRKAQDHRRGSRNLRSSMRSCTP